MLFTHTLTAVLVAGTALALPSYVSPSVQRVPGSCSSPDVGGQFRSGVLPSVSGRIRSEELT